MSTGVNVSVDDAVVALAADAAAAFVSELVSGIAGYCFIYIFFSMLQKQVGFAVQGHYSLQHKEQSVSY
jgi:hypothetical protein